MMRAVFYHGDTESGSVQASKNEAMIVLTRLNVYLLGKFVFAVTDTLSPKLNGCS